VKFFGESIPDYFSVKKLSNSDLKIFKVKDISEQGFKMRAPPYTLTKGKSMLHRYSFAIPCKFSLTDLDGKTTIEFTDFYHKLIGTKHIFHNILQIKFLQRNMLMIHAACVNKDGKGIIVTGWDKSGKTTTASIIDNQLLSDDITITDGKMFYAYPRTIRKFTGFKFPLQSQLSYIPYFNRFLKKIIGYEERFDIKPRTKSVKPDYIFAIRREGRGIKKLTKEEAVRFLMNQSMYHGAFSDPKFLLFAYASYYDFDIPIMFKKRLKILEDLCSKTKNYMVMSEDKTELAEMMKKTLKKS
ncbi:MAG: hypothetical protein GW914_01180, partial [Candidatus Aenigmarchaeota archaeon]|nr:hypothetical protein [Candidatus Aenigmarchaeota archaeon]